MGSEINNRTVGSKLLCLPKTVTLTSYNTKDNGSIPLPNARVDWILLAVKFNVTAATINAGETFFGMLQRLSIGSANRRALIFESNEATDVAAFLGGNVAGLIADPLPTTTVDAHAYVLIKGPFQFAGVQSPEIFIELKAPTDEWAAATAFAGEISASVLLSDDQSAPGYIVERQYRPTSTRHEVLGLGPGFVEDILLINGGAAAYTTRIELSRDGLNSPVIFTRPYELGHVWSAHRQAANTTGMVLENVDLPVSGKRELVVINGTTDTLTAFFKNIAGV